MRDWTWKTQSRLPEIAPSEGLSSPNVPEGIIETKSKYVNPNSTFLWREQQHESKWEKLPTEQRLEQAVTYWRQKLEVELRSEAETLSLER